MHDWARLLEPLRADRTSGSSQLYQQLLSILTTALNQSELVVADLVELPAAVTTTRREMACFHYAGAALAAAVTGGGGSDLTAHLRELLQRLTADHQLARTQIVSHFWPIGSNWEAIMLHSNSGILEQAVTEIFNRKTRIFLSEARPDVEGMRLATKLAADKFAVTIFPDDARLTFLKEVNAVLLGADWIAEADFTNKVGTHALCRFAADLRLPVYVLADRSKLAPAHLRPSRQESAVPIADRITRIDRLFEETPNRLVTSFVTDLGALSPAQLPAAIHENLSKF